MNVIVSLMAAGAKKNFSKEEFRRIRKEADAHSEKVNPAVAMFDIVSCPYYAMCRKYHCIELNPAFCDSDDAKYGNLHKNLKWARTGTIGKGASCCDFRIIDISRCPDYKD